MRPDDLGRLVDRHAAALALYARQWCLTPDDVVQEAFLRLAALAAPPVEPAAWLFRAVRNAAVSAARSARRRVVHEAAAAARTPSWFAPGDGTGLDAATAAEALTALPPEQRETVVAHLWGGLSFEQVGALTSVSSSTAHRRYQAALASLRERLDVACPDPTKPR